MEEYLEMDKRINYLLHLKRKVVGIFFFATEKQFKCSDLPAYDRLIPYCKAVQRGSAGECFKLSRKNFACPASAVALGLIENDDYSANGQKHAELNVYCDRQVSKKVADDMVYCREKSYGIGIAPIERWTEPPAVVLIITTPYNGMRLIQGHAYYSGQLTQIKMAGMQAICQEGTSYPLEKQLINISMMCSGTRHVAQWREEELCIGIPFTQFEKVIAGMEETLNPMELLKQKKEIIERMAVDEAPDYYKINKKDNYFRGAYRGIKY